MTWLLPPWLRIALKIAPYVAIGLLTAALLQTRATLHNVRQEAALDAERASTAKAEAEAAWAKQGQAAAETYAKALASIQPVVIRSIDRVQTYAQTPEGRAPCLSADRVRSIAEDRAALFPTAPSGGAGTLPANGAPIVQLDQRRR